MPSLLDPTLLRGQQPGEDPTGIQTLLGSIGSALSGGVAQPNDPNTTMAAILAAGNTLANAGAPTLGPPPTTAQAILGALGSARGAAVQSGILPYLQERAQQQLESQNLDYQTKMFDFQRRLNYANMIKQGVGADASGSAPAAPGVGTTPPAPGAQPSGDIASLPDVQALPDATRIAAIQAMTRAQLSPDEAAQYARMLMAESGGLHIDPKTNQVIKSSKGASGVAQVMPQTFLDMAQAHDDVTGSVADLMPNLLAGAHFFHDQVVANNGDLRNAAIGYNFGPGNLIDYLAGKKALPAETTDYLAKVRPGSGVQVADASGRIGGGAGSPPAPPGGPPAPPNDPLVRDPVSGAMVPRSILQAAIAAGGTAADGPAAHAAVIKDYLEKKALLPVYRPGALPGTQVTSQGQTEVSPTGTQYIDSPTADERSRMFSNVPSWQNIIVTRDATGKIVKHEIISPAPEPQITMTDDEAKRPIDQGGLGDGYRTGTTYQRGQYTGKITPVPIERGAGPPLAGTPGGATIVTPQQQQKADFLQTQAAKDPRIQQFQLGVGYVGRIINMAADPSRTATDDKSILAAFEKFNNPTAALSEDGQNLILTTGGPGERVQQIVAKLTGDRYLTPDVVQHVIDTVTTEAEGQRAGFTVASNNYRRMATKAGIDPEMVTPDPDEMVKEYMQQWEQSRKRLSAGTGVGGRTPVPGAQPTERAGNLPPVPVPTSTQLGTMTPQGLTALVNDIKTNPRYGSQEQRQLHLDAVQAEINRRPKAQQTPAASGG